MGVHDCARRVWQAEGFSGFVRSPAALFMDTTLAVGYLLASGAAASLFEFMLSP